MKVVVCDASPLIFLSKLDRLNLIPEVLGGRVCVLRCVVDEVCSEKASPLELIRLKNFFKEVEVVDFHPPSDQPSLTSLSQSDQSSLHWAINNRADWMVVDERLLRRIALENGISVVGFLGILVAATRKKLLTPAEAQTAVDHAVSDYDCQISIALYQRIRAELESMDKID